MTSPAPSSGLPLEVNTFVGRRRELAEAKHLLSVTRLVTVVGPGGVGKTRFSLKLSGQLQNAFRDGVCLVRLAELRDPALLPHALADSLGLHVRTRSRRSAAVVTHLASKHLLLIMDNCEQILEPTALLVDEILRACPRLHVLATSRQPLRIGGESILQLPPLSAPDPERVPSLEALAQYDAVNLFLDRATSVVPGFRLTEDNYDPISRLCHVLDGVPLALELAAVRLRALSPEQILERVADRHGLLATGSRSAPLRHQTLQAMIDWSHDLCSAEERTLWARLSVFAGSFELDAAEGVCSGEGIPKESILDLVAGLVDKSILARDESDRRSRYRMLRTIRQYGEDKLAETGELTTWQGRHRDWYAELVSSFAGDWVGPRQADWITRLSLDRANLRMALDFCLSHPGEGERGLQMAIDLEFDWSVTGRYSEGRQWLDRALANQGQSKLAARGLALNALFAIIQSDHAQAVSMLDRAEGIARRKNDRSSLARVALGRGAVAMWAGQFDQAAEFLERAITELTSVKDLSGAMFAMDLLGLMLSLAGKWDDATSVLEQTLVIAESHHDAWFRSSSLVSLGISAWTRGDYRQAKSLLGQGLQIERSLKDQTKIAFCLAALAWIAVREQHSERAATLIGAAETLFQAMELPFSTLQTLETDHHKAVATARLIGERAYGTAHRRGSRMSAEEAISFALGEDPHKRSDRETRDATPKLTRREQAIAELIAEGLTNRAIADRLVIAQRTAEGHVEHILSKLGFTSRAQIAAWVAEHRSGGAND